MKTVNLAQPAAAAYNPEKRQDDDKTPARGRVRSGVNTTAYWKGRLFRNSYRDRTGKTVEMPEWYARFRHEGITKRVRLRSADKDQAAEDALRLSHRLEAEGWMAVTDRQARVPKSPSIDEFCDLYRKAAASMERVPRPVSVNLYCRCLRLVCRYAGVRELRQLTPEAIEHARDLYRAEARKSRREDAGIQNTLSKVLRNAAACFSREACAILSRNGLDVENPFEGIRRTQEIQPVYALPEADVERIWQELPLLRDGNPKAEDPNQRKLGRKKPPAPAAAREAVDFRKPYPASYAAVLLALGAGLRANEIDKARWSWFRFGKKDECFLIIGPETDFRPKGGSARSIKIPYDLFSALEATRHDKASPYVLGGQETVAPSVLASESYRCRDALAIANAWLRARGIESEKKRGNPLHRLRKQFGSFVATEFGLFAAQKALGHSSPTVTSKYYAGQTELPDLTHVRIVG